MILYPIAKINIGLDIIRKRDDGYHDIETVFYPIALSDELSIVPSDVFSLQISGIEIESNTEDNLVTKAFRLMEQEHGISPVSVCLKKNIPTGAGLGGGSSDAAFMIKGLNELYSLNLTSLKMREYAASLGSDCAFFIDSTPSLACGRGEQLTPINLNLNNYRLLLVKPDEYVSTREAYSGVTPSVPAISLSDTIKSDINQWKHKISNQFEESVFAKHPAIATLKSKMYESGALYAAMSGSGSSVFGIFDTLPCHVDYMFKDCFIWTDK